MVKNFYALSRNDFKIRIVRQNVVVDKKNECVVARIEWRLVAPDVFDAILFGIDYSLSQISGVAKGVARCKEGDVFDEEKGVKIAIAMAESNAYTNASSIIAGRILHLGQMINKFSKMERNFARKAYDVRKHNVDYIERIAK